MEIQELRKRRQKGMKARNSKREMETGTAQGTNKEKALQCTKLEGTEEKLQVEAFLHWSQHVKVLSILLNLEKQKFVKRDGKQIKELCPYEPFHWGGGG